MCVAEVNGDQCQSANENYGNHARENGAADCVNNAPQRLFHFIIVDLSITVGVDRDHLQAALFLPGRSLGLELVQHLGGKGYVAGRT